MATSNVSRFSRLFHRACSKKLRNLQLPAIQQKAKYGTASTEKEYAFEMACSNIRYGEGVTREVGLDCLNMGAKKVCVMTDKYLVGLDCVKTVLQSLDDNKVNYKLYSDVRVEPTDQSFQAAIDYAKAGEFDVFIAIGGGSVMDTCKAANLYSTNPTAELLDYVNAPIGKGLPVTHQLKPLIAVTTTAGTGSETTGTAVFDYLPMKAKTGISNRAIRPTLGIVDPLHLRTMPERVTAYSGIDVLCHAIESYTAIPYEDRVPRPANPNLRPAYQGCNPISDIWCMHALKMTNKYIKRAVYDAGDHEARGVMGLASTYAGIGFGNGGVHLCDCFQITNDIPGVREVKVDIEKVRAVYDIGDTEARAAMHIASCYAGIGFGNSGTHLCHGMSYPISGMVKNFKSKDYDDDHPMVPHGLSVIVSAPAVFMFTAPACPERHLQAAEFLGVDVTNKRKEDAGPILADRLREIMQSLEMPDGLSALGYDSGDIPALVKGTLPQHRVNKLAPRPQTEDDFAMLFENSMKNY